MKRWWISWETDEEDYRPLHVVEDTDGLLGWWCSGDTDDFKYLIALVEAECAKSAWLIVTNEWPEQCGRSWRFFEERAADYLPDDRFPMEVGS